MVVKPFSMSPTLQIQVQGHKKIYPHGITPGEILKDISTRSGGDILAANINGSAIDLSRPLTNSGELEFISVRSPKGLEILRHSTAHVMAQAVKELFDDAKITIGPAIEDGFYYDFDVSRPFTPDDLEKIENRMKEIIRSKLPFRRIVMPKDQARLLFQEKGETYKIELLDGIDEEEVTLYSQGDFTDLCRGPHIPDSGFIKAFKLTKVAGAYWRGDERNPMLQEYMELLSLQKKIFNVICTFWKKRKSETIESLEESWTYFQW